MTREKWRHTDSDDMNILIIPAAENEEYEEYSWNLNHDAEKLGVSEACFTHCFRTIIFTITDCILKIMLGLISFIA